MSAQNPSRDKGLRSKRLYWIIGTVAVTLVLLIVYYSVYVSSEQAYYNDRAFRLLATMGERLGMDVGIVRDVLAAAGSYSTTKEATEYPLEAMHGVWASGDFVVTAIPHSKRCPSHQGVLTLSATNPTGRLRLQADYEEQGVSAEASRTRQTWCDDATGPLSIHATVNLEPMVEQTLEALSEGFFDDIWIADAQGQVWSQLSPSGIRVQNARALLASQAAATSWNPFSKADPQTNEGTGSSEPTPPRTVPFWSLGQFSRERDIALAGSQYKLYLQPLPLSIRNEKGEEQKLVLCGLRSARHAQAQALTLPYTSLIWGILATITAFAVTWPFLKLHYMSPAERLRGRQLFYFIFSVVLATACMTLLALNVSYSLTNAKTSDDELRWLAEGIQSSMEQELRSALFTLEDLSSDPSLLKLAGTDNWNQPEFLKNYGSRFFQKAHPLSYPYLRYFFLADGQGWQRLKFTVNPKTTPRINVQRDAYFHPVMDGEFSHLAKGDGGDFEFVMTPLYSPNTGEFLVTLASPFQLPAGADPGLKKLDLKLKVLAIKFESLFNPVVPMGYGYAVVDPQGKVLFHSVSVRNLTEDFTKETQSDVSLRALLTEGANDSVNAMYLGAKKRLRVTPIRAPADLGLTLIVFKDSSYFTTVNAAVVIVFTLLLSCYGLVLLLGILIHMLRQRNYPLAAIWPSESRKGRYVRIFLANYLLSATFFLRYGYYGVSRAFLAVVVVALMAAICTFVESSRKLADVLVDLLALGVLFWIAGFTWVIVLPLGYIVIALYFRASVFEKWVRNSVKLPQSYTLMATSVLLVLVVVPTCGFFEVSYDFVHRVFLQRKQLDLVEKLQKRGDAIEDYFLRHSKTGETNAQLDNQLAEQRQALSWDRYDRLFLNPKLPGEIHNEEAIYPNFVERTVVQLTSWFPSNALGAELTELATGSTTPYGVWEQATYTSKTNTEVPVLILCNRKGEQAVSTVRGWPALDWRVYLPVGIAIGILVFWIHFVHSRIFLLSLSTLPPLDRWSPARGEIPEHSLLVIAHPKAGKRLTVRKLDGVEMFDCAKMAATHNWKVAPTSCGVVALAHFEFDIDNPGTNAKKLHLLEDLLHVQRKRIILLSTVDPMFYLTGGQGRNVVPGKAKDLNAAIRLMDRWAAVLAHFRKVTIHDITEEAFTRIVEGLRRRRSDPHFLDFIQQVVQECDHTAHLRKLGAVILCAHRRGSALSHQELIEQILDLGDSYYRVLWSTCTRDERLVLYQLAEDGWANPKNDRAIQQLQRRKLVFGPPALRIMNESFRQFIRNSQYREEIATWEQEGEQSVWRSLKLSLMILAVAVAAWLLYSQQQFFNTVVGYLGAIGGAAGVLIKLIGELRGGKGAAANGSQ